MDDWCANLARRPSSLLNGVSARVHTRRERSLECVYALLVRGIGLSFLLLLLLGSGLRSLLFGCFISSSLSCATHHGPGCGSGGCSLTRFIVGNRPNRGASGCSPGGTFYTTPFCLLGVVRSCLLFCFLLLCFLMSFLMGVQIVLTTAH